MSDTDIKMSDVFELPVRRHYSVIVESDENQRHDTEAFDAAVHAINSHDALVEQSKALKVALERLCCSPHTRLTKHVLLEVSETDIDAAIKALEQAK
jgi:hypothetical protein